MLQRGLDYLLNFMHDLKLYINIGALFALINNIVTLNWAIHTSVAMLILQKNRMM